MLKCKCMVTESQKCNFVIWTEPGLLIVKAGRDESYVCNILSKTKNFVEMYLISELLERKVDVKKNELERDDAAICSCNRPRFGRIIICSNADCLVKEFHYICVGLKRRQKKWLW